MSKEQPPPTYEAFIERYPRLGEAWRNTREAEASSGPLDERQRRLVKMGIAIGAMREGAVHSAARKALRDGIAPEEIEQIVALAASTIGLPSAVATWTWVRDVLDDAGS